MKLAFILVLVYLAATHCASYDYTEKDWPEICGRGNSQSPIDFSLEESFYTPTTDGIINVNYSPISNMSFTLGIFGVDKVEELNPGNTFTYRKWGEDNAYELINFHWHIPSEHTIEGVRSAAELHLVHRKKLANGESDQDPSHPYIVIAVLFENDATQENQVVRQMNIRTQSNISGLDLTPYVATDRPFFTYYGGLTTPPCFEAVQFVVLTDIAKMTKTQFDDLDSLIKKSYPSGNNRQIQGLNSRVVWYKSFGSANFLTNFLENLKSIEIYNEAYKQNQSAGSSAQVISKLMLLALVLILVVS